MDRIIDQTILGVLCLLVLSRTPASTEHVVALLAAVIVACCFELNVVIRLVAALAFLIAALVYPPFVLFLPVVVYGMFTETRLWLRFLWVVPLLASLRTGEYVLVATSAVLSVAACLMSWRTLRVSNERIRFRHLRDEQQETALALKQKNRDLMAAQDYEVRLATLTERGRIAREIHDNVGHLLTRSIMQVEALQVVHAQDDQVKEELTSVGATLHEAMDTVRASVHDLHDDAFDLRSRLESVIATCGLDGVRLVFDAETLPQPIAYGMLSVVREALSNTARHSDATRVDVSVVEYPALYQLIVQDNGSPAEDLFAPAASVASDTAAIVIPPQKRGIGLQTMEERITALGGRLRVEYARGFRVFATIPKSQEEMQ